MKNKRDADRAKMREEIRKKAKKKSFKNKPSFEIMDVTEAERDRG